MKKSMSSWQRRGQWGMNAVRSEELIQEFYLALRESRRSAAAAGRDRDRLRFFLYAYVMEEWPRDLDRVDGEILRDFLGSWFLRHVGGSKEDLLAYVATFRRFYSFLYQSGRISGGEYEEIELVLESETFFVHRLEEYRSSAGWGVEEDELDFSFLSPAAFGTALKYPGVIDRQLWFLVYNLEKPDTPAVFDFTLFLDYVSNLHLRLTGGKVFPRRHLLHLNQRFSQPEDVRPETPSCRIPWFLQAGLHLNLLEITPRGELKSRRTEAFLDLEPSAQLTLLIHATWNLIPWAELGPPSLAQISEWAQRHRDGFAALLLELFPEREFRLKLDTGAERYDALLARYIFYHPVIERAILFALHEMGMVRVNREPSFPGSPASVSSLALTRFGRQIFRLFLRRAERANAAPCSALDRLEEALFSP